MAICWIHQSLTKKGKVIDNEFILTRIPTPSDMQDFITDRMKNHARVLRMLGNFEGAQLAVNEVRIFANIIQPSMLLTSVDGLNVEIYWQELQSKSTAYA